MTPRLLVAVCAMAALSPFAQEPAAHPELAGVHLAQSGLMPVVRQQVPADFSAATADGRRRDELDVEVVVGTSGTVLHARVAGARPDRAAREHAVLDAVRRWEFSPAINAPTGSPLPTLAILRVTVDPGDRGAPPRMRARLVAPPRNSVPARAADVTATVYVPGSPGLTEPRLVRTIRPNYAAGAARIKGVVKVDALILPDGTVGEARVLRSLQRDLDREALIALRYWLFAPATVDGQPVGYKAILDLEFGS